MGFICNALLSFSLFFINKCFNPTSNSFRNRKKYKELVKLTKKVSKFMVKLDRKWTAIIVSDADFSNPEELFLNKLDPNLCSVKSKLPSGENASKKPLEKSDLTDEDAECLEREINEDLSEIKKQIEEDAFIL